MGIFAAELVGFIRAMLGIAAPPDALRQGLAGLIG